MALLVGIVLSAVVVLFARTSGFDRDRAFYPTLVIVVASYYVLFAVLSGSMQTLVTEGVVMAVFVGAAVAGFRAGTWVAVAVLAAHGLFDAVHGHIVLNAGMPAWWPVFCGAFDVGAAVIVAPILPRER